MNNPSYEDLLNRYNELQLEFEEHKGKISIT